MGQQNIINRLDRIEKTLMNIQKNMIDIDIIITDEERRMLDESVEHENQENLISSEKLKKEIGI